MNLQDLLSELSGGVIGTTGGIPQQINDLSYKHAVANGAASKAEGKMAASGTAAGVIQCIVAAATPLTGAFENSASPQARLLFTLLMAGACSTVVSRDDRENEQRIDALEVEISPSNIREAIRLYKVIMNEDVTPHLRRSLRNFVGDSASALN